MCSLQGRIHLEADEARGTASRGTRFQNDSNMLEFFTEIYHHLGLIDLFTTSVPVITFLATENVKRGHPKHLLQGPRKSKDGTGSLGDFSELLQMRNATIYAEESVNETISYEW